MISLPVLPWTAGRLVLRVQPHLRRRGMHCKAHDGVEHAGAPTEVPVEHTVVLDFLDTINLKHTVIRHSTQAYSHTAQHRSTQSHGTALKHAVTPHSTRSRSHTTQCSSTQSKGTVFEHIVTGTVFEHTVTRHSVRAHNHTAQCSSTQSHGTSIKHMFSWHSIQAHSHMAQH
jgi:hypothetical protein